MASRRSREYKKDSLPEDTVANRVQMWRLRICEAKKHLNLDQRILWAEDANIYLSGGKEVPTKGSAKKTARIFLNYTLPLLEGLHRDAIPDIPAPVLRARTRDAFARQDVTQEFLNYQFDINGTEIIKAIEDGQWDDDKMGVAVFRADWEMKTVTANPLSDIAQEKVDAQKQRAIEENLNRDKRVIAASDSDATHLLVHEEYLGVLDPADPNYQDMESHVLEHRTRLITVTKEGVRFERVGPDKYIYDDSAGWKKRGWECEIKDVRVKFLIDNGYKNVTPKNAPPLDRSATIPYEDKMVRIAEIHDRLNDKEYVIATEGEGDMFLMDRPWRYGSLDIYKLITFHPFNPDQSWGVPLMFTMIPILNELAVVDYYIQRHVQNHPTPKIIVASGAGAKKIKKAIKDPDQMIVEVPPEQAGSVSIFNPPPIPVSLRNWRNDLLNELRRAAGVDAQDTGQNNPHEVSATESFARSQSGAGRITDRQKVIVDILSWLGDMILKLYKDFALEAVDVEINRGNGPEWTLIEPRDLPVDISMSFEIEAVTDKARTENITRVDRVNTYLRTSQAPINHDLLDVWTLTELGVKRPNQFRVAGPISPENVEDAQGRPGIEGGDRKSVV